MTSANDIYRDTIAWLVDHYGAHTFYTERDLVWTVQNRIASILAQHQLPLRVFNDYPIKRAERRSLCVDLAIVSIETNQIHLAAEFKYEPSHSRLDIPKSKFPVVLWGKDGVRKDIERAQLFVREDLTPICYTEFIDEGGAFRHRNPHPTSTWESWGEERWALRSCAKMTPQVTT